MTVRIVTDSGADLPAGLAETMGITVVPLYVRFGEEVCRDRIDISEDEFYQRLGHTNVHPSTVQPGPQDFLEVYRRLAADADGILSIHISSKLSGTCNSALMAAKEMEGAGCPVVVIDSLGVTMGLGLLVIAAATMANAGESLEKTAEFVRQGVAKTRLMALFDTLKFLLLGGRIGKASALLGTILNVKPLLSLKEGEVVPAGKVRTRSRGVEKLVEFAGGARDIQDMAVVYSTTPDEAQALAERLSGVFDREKIRIARLGPAMGVHMGPGALIVAVREG